MSGRGYRGPRLYPLVLGAMALTVAGGGPIPRDLVIGLNERIVDLVEWIGGGTVDGSAPAPVVVAVPVIVALGVLGALIGRALGRAATRRRLAQTRRAERSNRPEMRYPAVTEVAARLGVTIVGDLSDDFVYDPETRRHLHVEGLRFRPTGLDDAVNAARREAGLFARKAPDDEVVAELELIAERLPTSGPQAPTSASDARRGPVPSVVFIYTAAAMAVLAAVAVSGHPVAERVFADPLLCMLVAFVLGVPAVAVGLVDDLRRRPPAPVPAGRPEPVDGEPVPVLTDRSRAWVVRTLTGDERRRLDRNVAARVTSGQPEDVALECEIDRLLFERDHPGVDSRTLRPVEHGRRRRRSASRAARARYLTRTP